MTPRVHQWVRLTQQAVDVIVAPDGQHFVVERDDAPLGEGYGCAYCGEPLTSSFVLAPCVPVEEPVVAA